MNRSVAGEDQQDIRATLAGDAGAYARLVGRHQAAIAEQMRRFSREPEIIAELVQDVFVEAHASLAGFRGQAPLLHWLRRIATRVGYRHWRVRDRERRARAAWAERLRTEPAWVEPAGPREAAEFLYELLAHLPPAERLALTLYYFEGCDTREIAARTGWSRTWVKVRTFRGRRRLRAWLLASGCEGVE